jgi:quercetin dioxygenase-like cupin family protein
VHPGETIYFAPGEEHFHAAGSDGFMEHIAIIESADDPATTTTWLEQVTDAEFNGE